MIVANDLTELIGHSPVLKIKTVRSDWDLYLKLESFNPSGSFKDRTAWGLISAAEERGALKPGTTIVESSSGNTAKALAMMAAARGYRFIAVVDKHAPADKLNAIRVYGGELYFCVDEDDPAGGHLVDVRRDTARRLARDIPGAVNLDQYDNPDNPRGYYRSLGPELLRQIPRIDVFVGTIGTGSSLSGTSRYLKEHGTTTVVALEPKGSAHFSPRGHGYFISGPGYPPGAKLPKNIDHSVINRHDVVSDAQAFNTMRYFAAKKGLLMGDSGGMVAYYAMKHIGGTAPGPERKTMVLLVGDGGESYLSHAFNETWMIENELLDPSVEKELAGFYI